MAYLNTNTNQYPLTESDIKAANLTTSYTLPFAPGEPYAWVFPTPQPTCDAVTQIVRQAFPQEVDGKWYEVWEVVSRFNDYTDDEGVLHTRAEQIAEQIAAHLDNARTAALRQIDTDTDAIYAAKMGNRGTEYTLAEQDATAYKAAGYIGTVPASVQSWATAKKQTAQWATDDILATATAWRQAQAVIRDNRLARKEDVRDATDQVGIDAAMATWAAFVTYIKTQLGL